MPPLSDAERAKHYRYATQLMNAVGKLGRLMDEMPEKYRKNPHLLPVELEFDLLIIMNRLYQSEFDFMEIDGEQYVAWKTRPILAENDIDQLESDVEIESFQKYIGNVRASSVPAQEPKATNALKMTRNAFCEQVLGAKLANARWGWVGIKEKQDEADGALYLFGWESKLDGDTLVLFHKEVGVDNNGRRRPGHRDALEKIGRAVAGELTPYVVWQTAVDPEVSPKTIESINGDYITECELFINDDGFWAARLLRNLTLPTLSVAK